MVASLLMVKLELVGAQLCLSSESRFIISTHSLGKSYTIEGGVDEHRGIVPRAADAIFHCMFTM